jgi:hypothetical protein
MGLSDPQRQAGFQIGQFGLQDRLFQGFFAFVNVRHFLFFKCLHGKGWGIEMCLGKGGGLIRALTIGGVAPDPPQDFVLPRKRADGFWTPPEHPFFDLEVPLCWRISANVY